MTSRTRTRALVGSLVFLLVAPGVVAALVPWLLTGWEGRTMPLPAALVGCLAIVTGGAALLGSFLRFALEGVGTPAPVAPTERLVVGGLYRFVRNPMYLAVGAVIVGQGVLLGRLVLVVYAAVFAAAVWSFVHWVEEPSLERRFGESYATYRRAVPGWWPRLRPWEPGSPEPG